MPIIPHSCLAGLACLAALVGSAPAADPKPAGDNPQARQLLDDVIKAYQVLPAYADRGGFTLAMTLDGKAHKQTLPLNLSLARPNKLNLDTKLVRLVSDGTTLTTAVAPSKNYTKVPAPRTI